MQYKFSAPEWVWNNKENHLIFDNQKHTNTRVAHGIDGGVYKDALLRPRIVYNRLCYRVLKHNHFPLFL